MNSLIKVSKGLLFFTFLLTANYGLAKSFTSINDGNWDNETNVWSIDGQTPCSCSPGKITNGNNITINNNILTSYDVIINNYSSMTVSSKGSLKGNYNVVAKNATINVKGIVELAKYMQESQTNLNILNGGVLNISHCCSILNGTIEISQGQMFLSSGNLSISKSSTMNITNDSALIIEFGELLNQGIINLDHSSYNGNNPYSEICLKRF